MVRGSVVLGARLRAWSGRRGHHPVVLGNNTIAACVRAVCGVGACGRDGWVSAAASSCRVFEMLLVVFPWEVINQRGPHLFEAAVLS